MHYRSISPDVLDIRAASKRDQGETNARYRITLQHDIWSKAREITNKSRRDRGEIKSHYNLISGPKQERPRTKRGEIKERPNRITSSYVAQSKRQAAQRGKRERGNREMQQREATERGVSERHQSTNDLYMYPRGGESPCQVQLYLD